MAKAKPLIDIQLDYDALYRQVQALEKELQGPAIKAGLRASAMALKKAMRAEAPVEFGTLRDSISYYSVRPREMAARGYDPDTTFGYMVGTVRKVEEVRKWGSGRRNMGKRAQYYKAIWLEVTGARPHVIQPRKSRMKKSASLSFRSRKARKWAQAAEQSSLRFGHKFAARVMHPGMRRNKFMSRAEARTNYEQLVATGINQHLAKAISKAGAGNGSKA